MPMQPCQLQQVLKSLQACTNCSCIKWDAACAGQTACILAGCLQGALQGWRCTSCCCITGMMSSYTCAVMHLTQQWALQQEPL